jgi:hypothetical protein
MIKYWMILSKKIQKTKILIVLEKVQVVVVGKPLMSGISCK